MPRLEGRRKRLEAAGASRNALPSIWVQAVSRYEDSQEVRDAHVQAARGAYIQENGGPGCLIGCLHYIAVMPRRWSEADECPRFGPAGGPEAS